jgi:replicative DNA helicase
MFAKETQLPVLLLGQLSNSYESDNVGREAAKMRKPAPKDMFGSSKIGQSAAALVMIHNPYKILGDDAPTGGGWVNKGQDCEFCVPICRFGKGGSVKMRWEGDRLRFEER